MTTVAIQGTGGIESKLEDIKKAKNDTNNHLEELIRLKKIEVTNKKPEIMFLYELLEFLRTIPQWSPENSIDEEPIKPKACFVGEKWDGKVVIYRDHMNLCDYVEIEGERIFFDVNYYINKLSMALNELTED